MTYYLQAMRGFSDFRGRARRAEYWMFVLVHLGIHLVAGILDAVPGTTQLLGAPVPATRGRTRPPGARDRGPGATAARHRAQRVVVLHLR